MPNQPYLDHAKTKVDGLAFIGLSLTRHSEHGYPDSITHQEAFDLNDVIDRDYSNLMSTNDDGWLVGGGEKGPPHSYKLKSKDSAHVEIMRIGNYRPEWGGITQEEIVKVMQSGKILIPQMEVVPTAVVANGDLPPELEIRFDMDPFIPDLANFMNQPAPPLPVNWSIRFVHNQLFKHFQFASRFCPGPFHSTIVRKADFRSNEHKQKYFSNCDEVVQKWREEGPKPLNTKWNVDGTVMKNPPQHNSGVWLFLDRTNITHHFAPNFLPPYDTPEKRSIIMSSLSEIWNQDELVWKPVSSPESSEKDDVQWCGAFS